MERAEAENRVWGWGLEVGVLFVVFVSSLSSSWGGGIKGSMTSAATAMLWPWRTCSFEPVMASQITIVVSADPEISIESVPTIVQLRHLTKSRCPLRK